MEPKPIKNVSLSYACEKNWNSMEEVAGGRFCDSCQHVVHDFTNQSDCELKKILNQNARVCGKFKRSQMSTDFLKYAAATLIAASGLAINSCSEEEIVPTFPIENIPGIEPEEVRIGLDSTETESFIVGVIINPLPVEVPEIESEDELDSGEE